MCVYVCVRACSLWVFWVERARIRRCQISIKIGRLAGIWFQFPFRGAREDIPKKIRRDFFLFLSLRLSNCGSRGRTCRSRKCLPRFRQTVLDRFKWVFEFDVSRVHVARFGRPAFRISHFGHPRPAPCLPWVSPSAILDQLLVHPRPAPRAS